MQIMVKGKNIYANHRNKYEQNKHVRLAHPIDSNAWMGYYPPTPTPPPTHTHTLTWLECEGHYSSGKGNDLSFFKNV